LFVTVEKVAERPGGSYSIDKWFTSGHDVKSVKKPADFTVKPEATQTSGGQSGGIWGDFESDSVPDAVLLTAADAVERCEIKAEQSRPDLHFPGRGQKLAEASNSSVPPGSIVRRIPGVGVITGRNVIGDNKVLRTPFKKPSVNAAASNLSQHQSFSHSSFTGLIPKSDIAVGNPKTSSASSVTFESVADFRKTVGMVMSPSGTEVRVKNFVSVCNRNALPSSSRNIPPGAPRLKSGRSVGDDDANTAVRPVKKMRYDTEASSSDVAASTDSKKSAGNIRPNNLALHLNRSVSAAGDDAVIMVDLDSESKRVEDSEQHQESVKEELNAHQSKSPSNVHGIVPLEASFDEVRPSDTDQAVGGTDSSSVFHQTGCVICPVCQISVPADIINEHLDRCLT